VIHIDVHFARADFTLAVSCETGARAVGLFGPSGAGKTTLINLIAGLQRPDRGTIIINGRTLFDDQKRIDVPVHRRNIGLVFQEHRLFPHLSVRGNLLYGQPRRAPSAAQQVVDVLELAGILRRRVTDISGGERQRVALGRALISQPALLLLDEPLTALDQRLKQQIIPYIQRVRDSFSIPMLYVSHQLAEILQLTDELIVLDRGAMIGRGRYSDLVHDQHVLPVVHDRGMQNLLPARIIRHDPAATIVQLGAAADPAPQLIVPSVTGAPGTRVMVSVQPWDIALATERVEHVSIQNQIRGTVTRCTHHDRSAIVEVDLASAAGESASLIVEVSNRSAAALALAPGTPIVCLIKSHALRVTTDGT
jgi:molybdate transport system ATP-binding protein